jgi:hypothetical protein
MKRAEAGLLERGCLTQKTLGEGVVAHGGSLFRRSDDRLRVTRI